MKKRCELEDNIIYSNTYQSFLFSRPHRNVPHAQSHQIFPHFN